MKISIRVDASVQMGIGHFMRCLTLADGLKKSGAHICFVSLELPVHLCEMLEEKGMELLPVVGNASFSSIDDLAHSSWLRTSQAQDAEETIQAISGQSWDWLIVDHYALDFRWERMLKPYFAKLIVIDDLADRSHFCDLLLDQTFGRDQSKYGPLVPSNCQVLCGSHYALLRPEFVALRKYSLLRRKTPKLRQLLITMGGVDKDNVTGQMMEILRTCNSLPMDFQITIVLGASAPWLSSVMQLVETMPWPTTVLVNVSNMAKLMAESDLAIGAAGATSWERCCLGLPTVMLTLADNQLVIASMLRDANAVITVDIFAVNFSEQLCKSISMACTQASMQSLSKNSAVICDGMGVVRVLEAIIEK